MKTSILPRLLLLGLCALFAACGGGGRPAPGPKPDEVMVLDNHGGVSHGGRRVVLWPDGRFSQTIYSDIKGNERKTEGNYRFSEDHKLLTLVAPSGATQVLHRVSYHGKAYWVKSGEQERIAMEGEDGLRKTSLRVVPSNAGILRDVPPLREGGS